MDACCGELPLGPAARSLALLRSLPPQLRKDGGVGWGPPQTGQKGPGPSNTSLDPGPQPSPSLTMPFPTTDHRVLIHRFLTLCRSWTMAAGQAQRG